MSDTALQDMMPDSDLLMTENQVFGPEFWLRTNSELDAYLPFEPQVLEPANISPDRALRK